MRKAALLLALSAGLTTTAGHADAALHAQLDQLADAVSAQVIADRRYLHQRPELSNREFETSKYLAKRLKALGYYDGEVDGNLGTSSKAAIVAFESRNGLNGTGEPSKVLLQHLRR